MTAESEARLQRALLFATLLLLPLVLLWPGPLVFTTELLTHPEREAASHVWGLASAELLQPFFVQSPDLSYPDGYSLVVADPGHVPLYALFGWLGPAAGYNGLLWLNLLLVGLGGAALAHREQAHPALGAALAMACPTLLASTAEGTTEDFAVGWVLIQLVLLLRLIDQPGWRRALPFAGALAMASYCGPYNGVWAGMLDLCIGLNLLRERRLAAAKWSVVGALLAGGLVLPQLWALGQRTPGLPGTGERAGLPDVIEVTDYRGGLHHGADLLDPWLPGPLSGGHGEVSHTAYVGLAALLLALWAWRGDRSLRPWILGAVAMIALSLGPYFYFRGEVLTLGDRLALGPAGFLMQALPPLGRLTRWYRAGAVASFLLLVPLLRLSRTRSWAPWPIAALILADLLLMAPLQWPLHHHPVPQTLPGQGPLLTWPAQTTDLPPTGVWRDHSVLHQTVHGRPIPVSFMEPAGPKAARTNRIVKLWLRSGHLGPREAQQLQDQGWTQLVIYPRLLHGPGAWRSTLSGCLGPPLVDTAEVVLWDLERLERCR